MAKTSNADYIGSVTTVLTGAVLGSIIVFVLYWAQIVLIPVMLAAFLTFILYPLVRLLQRLGIPRILAAVLVVVIATGPIVGVGWIVTGRVTDFLQELPKYAVNIKKKVGSLKNVGVGTSKIENLIEDVSSQLSAQPGQRTPPSTDQRSGAPPKVIVEPSTPPWISALPGYLRSAVELLGGLVLTLVLTLLMLLKREDLRNRFMRLAGNGSLTMTTKAVDDACQRISRFLFMQLLLNLSCGFALALGLLAIGIEHTHAFTWGLILAAMRYIPYIGAWIVGFLLFALSVAMFDNWTQPVLIAAMFVSLEIVASNFAEPWLYGKSIGISDVALLISAGFWALLWGPVGLILSCPLTVSLVVLGKYIPQLKFLDVLLGDGPVLAPEVEYYQRLLAHDADETRQIVLDRTKTQPPAEIFDELLVPALNLAKRDRDELSADDERFIYRTVRLAIEDLQKDRPASDDSRSNDAAFRPRIRLIGCPAQDETDEIALEMLRPLLDPDRWNVEILSANLLWAEMLSRIHEDQPAVVCVSSLPPDGLSRVCSLCRRLRAEFPTLKIMIGRWGLQDGQGHNKSALKEAGADEVGARLSETINHLKGWKPVLAQSADEAVAAKS